LSSPELGKFSLERLQDVVNISKALGWAAPQETSSIIASLNDPAAMANCLINNLTIENIVASKKMLLYSEYRYSLEGVHDESTKQTRITRSNTTTLSQSK
jgi:hypothetical protein